MAFCWLGASGWSLRGEMTVRDGAMSQPRVTEADVTRFWIEGFHNDRPVGKWNLADRTPSTSFNVNYDPAARAFVTGGWSNSDEGQQWNANGDVTDCGTPGFGFNSGASGQDVCVNGVWIMDSTIPADTPFHELEACPGAPLLGKR